MGHKSHSVYRVRDSGIWRCWGDKTYLTSRLETLVAIPLCCRWRSESRSTHTCHQSDPSGQLSSKWNALHRESNTTTEFWLLFLKDCQGCWHYCSLKRCPIFWIFTNKIMTIRSRKLEKKIIFCIFILVILLVAALRFKLVCCFSDSLDKFTVAGNGWCDYWELFPRVALEKWEHGVCLMGCRWC